MLKVPYLLQPATLRKLCHFDQRGEISSIYLFNSIRPLRCGRGDQLFITTYQTMLTLPMLHILCYYNLYTKLCHFDQRGEISSIYLFNSIRPLRCGRGDRIFAMLQTISGHIERSRDISSFYSICLDFSAPLHFGRTDRIYSHYCNMAFNSPTSLSYFFPLSSKVNLLFNSLSKS